jgi:hypothetical protein
MINLQNPYKSRGGDGDGPGNHYADVDSLGRSWVCSPAGVVGEARVRSRSRSPAVVIGGARCSREGVPLRCAPGVASTRRWRQLCVE